MLRPFPAYHLLSLCAALVLTPSLLPEEARKAAEPGPQAPPAIKLLNAGKESLRPLRLVVEKGSRETVVVSLDTEVSMQVGALPIPAQKFPTLELTLDLEVEDAAPGGDISYSFRVEKAGVKEGPGVSPAAVKSMRDQCEVIEGLSGSATVTDRGIVKELDVELPAAAPPQTLQSVESLRQTVRQLSVCFPEEPVGVGARWEVTALAEQSGLKVSQVSTYEVQRLDRDGVKLKFEVKQSAEPQDVKTPGLPTGAKVRLLALTATGKGEALLQLDRLSPERSETELTSDNKLRMESGGRSQETTTHLEVTSQTRREK